MSESSDRTGSNDNQTLMDAPPSGPRADAGDPAFVERPLPGDAGHALFGSDIVAEALRAVGVPYIALNPGASFRGLHDSLVNHLGNEAPTMLLCLHEEHAVAIAHGYAKVTGRAMAAALHSNVGLMHGTMAIFNAWCDRMPVIVIGATGPVDAMKRRPWIDWIHTARDQGAMVRGYTKWDDQPASPEAAREAIYRGAWLAQTAPMAPVYINLDAEMQEARLSEAPPPLDAARYTPQALTAPAPGPLAQAADLLRAAKAPVILAGRVSRDLTGWNERIELAERLQARVATDLKIGASFPTDHALHVGSPSVFPGAEMLEALRRADVILSLDWVDLGGTLRAAFAPAMPAAKVIQVSLDHAVHNGWSMDHQALCVADIHLAADPATAVPMLIDAVGVAARAGGPGGARADGLAALPLRDAGPLSVEHLAVGLRQAVGKREVSLTHLPLSWNGAWWPFRHPLDFLGSDGGGGIGGGPGISIGAALALRGSGRLPVAICGDGDFLMGATALWTAAHYRIPLLVVVANNRSFYNDEVHQERVARMRDRRVENKWIGQRIADPDVDIVKMARAQGAVGFGPVTSAMDMVPALENAIRAVEAGSVAVVDVRVEPGYTPAMTASLTRAQG
jgi:thiamine pyrophosphate-dependent acetolactate synthase large subunit-like protein